MMNLSFARENRAKRDRKVFADLITTPSSGALQFPANAQVYLQSVEGCIAGTTAATFGSNTIQTPDLSAGAKMSIGRIERGVTLTPAAGFNILIDVGLGNAAKIGGA